MSSPKSGNSRSASTSAELPRVTSDELCFLLSQPRTPRVVLHLLRSCGLTLAHVAGALGAPVSSVGNWSSGKSEPSDELYEKLDLLRTIASHVLANRLEGDNERIVKAFFLGRPAGLRDEKGEPCTPLEAFAAGREQSVIDAAVRFGASTPTTHTPLQPAISGRLSGD
jgi:hypothetical protein